MKPSRTRTKEKLKGKFSMKYKQSKEKEKFDQARFKTMDKKEKIKHIRGLVQVSNESSELQSSNSRNIDHPSNFQSKFMNSDFDLGQSMLDVGTDVRTFKKVIAVNNKNETKLKECTRMIEEFKQAKNYQFPDDAHHESELEYLRKERDRLFEENTLLKYGMGGQSQQIQPEFAIEEGQSHNDSFVSRVSSLQISGDSIHSDSVRLEDRSGPNRGSVLQTSNNMEEFPSLGGGNDPVSTNSKRSSKWDSGPNLNNIMRKPNNKKPKK